MANTSQAGGAAGVVKQVTQIGITEGIDTAKKFITELDERVETILDKYTQMTQNDVLSSAEIDTIATDIKARINKMKSNFDELSSDIQTKMQQSVEHIDAESKTIQL